MSKRNVLSQIIPGLTLIDITSNDGFRINTCGGTEHEVLRNDFSQSSSMRPAQKPIQENFDTRIKFGSATLVVGVCASQGPTGVCAIWKQLAGNGEWPRAGIWFTVRDFVATAYHADEEWMPRFMGNAIRPLNP